MPQSAVDQSDLDALKRQIIVGSRPDPTDPSGNTIANPDLAALVAAYNSLKGSPDRYSPINVGDGNIGIFDPATGKIDWTKGPPKTDKPETAAVPGRGVVDIQRPDGGVGPVRATTIPGTEPIVPASRTPEQIAAESASGVRRDDAATSLANAQAGAVETPGQRLAREKETIKAQAQAEYDAKEKELQAKLDAGLILPEKAKAEMEFFYKKAIADHDSKIRTAEKQFEYDLAQPNKDRELTTAAAQVENQRIAQQQAAEQADRNQQTDVLKTQAAGTSDFINQGIKLGVAPTAGLVRGAIDPLLLALNLSRQAIQNGAVPPTAMPRPSAPSPAQTPGQSVLREAPTPPPTPVVDPRYSNTAPPVRGPLY